MSERPDILVISGPELQDMFARVMHEWGHKPFRRGEVRLPTLEEAAHCVQRYCREGTRPLVQRAA